MSALKKETNVKSLEKDVDIVEDKVEELDKDVDKLEKDVDIVEDKVEELDKDVDKVEDKVEELDKDVDKLEERTKRNASKIESISRRFKLGIENVERVFGKDDFAQQFIGSIILSMPFITTQEVWMLADSLDWIKVGLLFILTVIVGWTIIYYTQYQKVKDHKEDYVLFLPLRIISLIAVAYFVAALMPYLFNVFTFGTELGLSGYWQLKLMVLLAFPATIGGAAADILK